MARAVGELQRIVLTYEDYLRLPNDGKRYEILEGEIVVSPSPVTKHQRISRNLLAILHHHVAQHKLGEVFSAPTDVVLSRTNVVQPDLFFVSHARQKIITEKNIQGAPDLVVEILSDTSEEQDRVAKKQIYARHGVKEYWLIDPDRETLEVYKLDAKARAFKHVATYQSDETVRSTLLPNLEITLAELWE
ncbi:MAG: Uma2 family endonuclease [Candidatus Bipolaricaulota bacterium]|nr:Uma2 family endonuclease [Candidatus Bipolaricaulota bacterium]MCS7275152.1 Uma2 family endonuclease [Candidatus Bipolaricaulota bacterium]MDW8111605.1 Uma2 family endonuclease [Candidatus Bipolaricaulota bacterium]MDW8329690.1 Uma2 family endonuclease [Candidatus Bipolaricaulota bacterium]